MSDTFNTFKERLFLYFDENANDSSSHYAFGQLCRDTRACFLAGDPLDPKYANVQHAALDLYREARVISDGALREVDRGLSILSEMMVIKGRAVDQRKRGFVELAVLTEATYEDLYRQLPRRFRW